MQKSLLGELVLGPENNICPYLPLRQMTWNISRLVLRCLFFVSDHLNLTPQGPGEETSPAFWSMVWQYQVTFQALKTRNSNTSFLSKMPTLNSNDVQVRVVVMLTNLVEGCGFPSLKCALYWPDKVQQLETRNLLGTAHWKSQDPKSNG